MIEFGVSPGYILTSKLESEIDDGASSNSSPNKKTNAFALNASLGVGYQLKINPMTIKTLPCGQMNVFKNTLNSEIGNTIPDMRYLTTGLKTVILY